MFLLLKLHLQKLIKNMAHRKKQSPSAVLFPFFLQIIAFISLFLPPSVSVAQTAHQLSRQGDRDFTNDKYKEAELSYRRAQEQKRDDRTAYNLGNSIYKQQRYDEALEHYGKIADKTKDNTLKSNSLYNQGNAHFYKKDYEKAVDNYKKALRLNPQDMDAKRNLAVAKRYLDKQKQEQQKQQQNQGDKNQQNQNQDQQNKDNKNQNKDEQNKQNQDKQNQNQQNQGDKNQQQAQNQQGQQNQQQNADPNAQQNPQQMAQQDLKKEDAKRMLQIMDDEERKVQQRLQKGKARPSRSSKDW
jgi:Ca-activated chloride channel homolog